MLALSSIARTLSLLGAVAALLSGCASPTPARTASDPVNCVLNGPCTHK